MKLNTRHLAYGMVALMISSAAVPSLAKKKKDIAAKSQQVQVADTLPANLRKRYDYFFTEAARKQAAGDYAEAFELLEHARQIKPQGAEVHYYESMYYGLMKKDSLAMASLQKAIALNPDNQTYAERLAQLYIGNKNYDKAIIAYEQLFAHNHDNTDALRILLQLYQQQKNYPMMLKTVNRLEVEEGESEQITLSKMRIYDMMNDEEAACNELKSLTVQHPLDMVYRTMLGNWLMQHNRSKEAYKLFTDVLKEEPDNSFAQSSLYDYYNAMGQTEQAKDMLDKILLSKKTDIETKAMMIRSFVQDNEAHGGDSTQVLSLFDRMLAQPQPSADIAEMRAAYMSLKKMPADTVDAAFQRVLDIAPDNANARLQIVQSLWNKKDYDAVVSMSHVGESYNPDEMVFYYFAGMAYYQKGDDDATLGEFRRGVAQVNEKSSPDLVSDLYMIMGDILYKKKDQAESFAAYDSCLQWKPDNYAGLNNYAYYLSVVGKDLHKAEQMSYKVIKAEPKNATYLDTYAWILFMQERYAEAKVYVDQTLKNLDSIANNTTLYEHAGDIYAMNGMTDEAVDFWKKASDGDGKNELLLRKIKERRYIADEQMSAYLKKDSLGKATGKATTRKSKYKNGKKKK